METRTHIHRRTIELERSDALIADIARTASPLSTLTMDSEDGNVSFLLNQIRVSFSRDRDNMYIDLYLVNPSHGCEANAARRVIRAVEDCIADRYDSVCGYDARALQIDRWGRMYLINDSAEYLDALGSFGGQLYDDHAPDPRTMEFPCIVSFLAVPHFGIRVNHSKSVIKLDLAKE